MLRSSLMVLGAFALCAFASAGVATAAVPSRSETAAASPARAQHRADVARLPLAFEPEAAFDAKAPAYVARGPGYRMRLAGTEALLQLEAPASTSHAEIRMQFAGGNMRAAITGIEPLAARSNYFVGSDPAKWRRNVANFGKVKAEAVYPGIDLVYYGNGRQLEYDFIVAPGADASRIALEFSGTSSVSIDGRGNLVLATEGGELVQHAPVVYQEIDGLRHPIDARYVKRGKSRVGFVVAAYDRRRPLVIDPTLFYATYLGAAGSEGARRVAVSPLGEAYVVGTTNGALPGAGGAQANPGGAQDVFVVRYNYEMTERIFTTYLGGSDNDSAAGIAVDTEGNAFVAGTARAGFPTTPGAFQTVQQPGADPDWFVAKLSADGSTLLYSTYVGGSTIDSAGAIAIDDNGCAYVVGYTQGAFPVTAGAYQTKYGGGGADAALVKLNATGSALVFSTYLGGNGADNATGVAVDGSGNAYVAGYTRNGAFPTTPGAYQTVYGGGDADIFIAKLDASGSSLVYSTFVGGSGEDTPTSVAVSDDGRAYVSGYTTGAFPVTPGAYQAAYGGGENDGLMLVLNAAGNALVHSTYLGGGGDDHANNIALDGVNRVFVVGTTTGGFPVHNATQPAYGGGDDDAFFAAFSQSDFSLEFATYIGTAGDDYGDGVTISAANAMFVVGSVGAAGLAVTPDAEQSQFGGGGYDAFVTMWGGSNGSSAQGLWWRYPAGSEAGWGINFAQQNGIIFATWFTYDANGKPLWLAATLHYGGGPGVYTGDVFTTTGPAFTAEPWDPATVTETTVGTMTVKFRDNYSAVLSYTVNGISQTKPITRQVFASPVSHCIDGLFSDLSQAKNYQDLWWAYPAASESGWGVNFTQQGDIIFYTWYTYGADGKPLWLIAVAEKQSEGVYSGPISTVTGPSFDAVPWDPANVVETVVGSTTITFADGNRASFSYTVNGVTQTKEITRQLFSQYGTGCE